MAFNIDYLQKVNSGANDSSSRIYVYNATANGGNETLSTIAASAYFNNMQQNLTSGSEAGKLKVGDIMFLNGSDAAGMYQVSSVTTNVAVTAYTSSAATASHVIKYAGQPTTAGGAAAEAITVTGALATDYAFVQMVDDGTNNVTIVDAVVTADTLTVTFSGDPGNDAVINYQIIRAV
jgi:butyrate kinase